MVKAIILYYLNIKSTHGYEIQKYIQATGLSVWAKVKSGSIYYALSKMEKSGEVELVREETKGSRVRRIYKITDKGREELNKVLKEEMSKNLVPIGTEKFILPTLIDKLDKSEGIEIINSHIKELQETLDYWNYWSDIKIGDNSLKLDRLSFEMTISNLEYSIKWHKALIEEYDDYANESKMQIKIIENFDFDELNDVKDEVVNVNLDKNKISYLREQILNNPESSKEALEELFNMLNQ